MKASIGQGADGDIPWPHRAICKDPDRRYGMSTGSDEREHKALSVTWLAAGVALATTMQCSKVECLEVVIWWRQPMRGNAPPVYGDVFGLYKRYYRGVRRVILIVGVDTLAPVALGTGRSIPAEERASKYGQLVASGSG